MFSPAARVSATDSSDDDRDDDRDGDEQEPTLRDLVARCFAPVLSDGVAACALAAAGEGGSIGVDMSNLSAEEVQEL